MKAVLLFFALSAISLISLIPKSPNPVSNAIELPDSVNIVKAESRIKPFDISLYQGRQKSQTPESLQQTESLMAESEAAVSLPVANYQIEKVIGQPDDKETMLNKIVANRAFYIGGVHVDSQDRVYVLDSGNNRILGFQSFQNNANQNADIVIGQVSTSLKGTANGNNAQYTQASNSTIALLPYPNVVSTLESPRSSQMATDSEDNFYLVDTENNRVLKFNSPFTSDNIADEVWGQPDFVSRTPHCGQDG